MILCKKAASATKNAEMFRYVETKYYLCTQIRSNMVKNTPKVIYLEEALTFIESIPKSAGDKLLETIHRIEGGEQNAILFSKLEGTNIWEFRTLYNKVKYRLFAFWDTQTDTIIIATHGIVKKTQKTPKKDIAKAERIRREYLDAKKI